MAVWRSLESSPPCQGGNREFKSRLGRHAHVAQWIRAQHYGCWWRGFESLHGCYARLAQQKSGFLTRSGSGGQHLHRVLERERVRRDRSGGSGACHPEGSGDGRAVPESALLLAGSPHRAQGRGQLSFLMAGIVQRQNARLWIRSSEFNSRYSPQGPIAQWTERQFPELDVGRSSRPGIAIRGELQWR